MTDRDSSTSYVRDSRGPYFTQVFHYEVDDYFQRIERKRRAHAIAVYVVVARHAGRQATAFPSLKTISELTGLARATVVEALKALKAAGLITSKKRTNKRGQATNLYELVSSPHQEVSSGDEPAVSSPDEHEEDTEEKKSVEANASSGIAENGVSPDSASEANVIGLEKHVTDKLYAAMDRAGYTLDSGDTFKYHLGRAKTMLEKMEPTDEELEALPASAVSHFEVYAKTDAMSALRYLRQQKARKKRLDEGRDEPAPWEPKNPHSPRPQMDPEKLAKEKARREQVARMLASAQASAS